MSMLLSQVIAPSSSPTVSTSLFCLHLYSCPVNGFICTIFLDSISQSVKSLSCVLTLCNPRDRSMPGLPVHHQLLEFTQTHVH